MSICRSPLRNSQRTRTAVDWPGLIFGVSCVVVLACGGGVLAQDAGTDAGLDVSPKAQDLPEPVNDEQAIEAIQRYVAAIGGEEVLNAIKDKTLAFDTVKHSPNGPTTAKLKQYLKEGTKIREEWDIPGYTIKDQPLRFMQVYNGFDGWVSMFGTVSPLEGRTLSIFVWDKPLRDFFLTWQEDGYTATYVNEGEIEGEPVDIVQMTDFSGTNRVRYYFSKDSGLIVKKEWREQGRGGYVKKEDHYETYRDIPFGDGSDRKVKFALHHKIYEEGEIDTERNYEVIQINSGLDDEIFAKPKGIAFKGPGSVDLTNPAAGLGAGGSTPAGGVPQKTEEDSEGDN